MRADDNVHKALLKVRNRALLLRLAAEPREHVHTTRKIHQPLGKGIEMLLCEDCGRH